MIKTKFKGRNCKTALQAKTQNVYKKSQVVQNYIIVTISTGVQFVESVPSWYECYNNVLS